MILTIVTLMVTHDHGALPVGSHSSPELYKVGAMTVSSPQMKTVRLREVGNSPQLTQPVSNMEHQTSVHIGASAPKYIRGPSKSKSCPASKDTLLVSLMTQILVSAKEKPSCARDACAPMCLAALSLWTQLVLAPRYSASSLAVILSGLSV